MGTCILSLTSYVDRYASHLWRDKQGLHLRYDEDVHQRTIKSLEDDEHMQYHRTMVCLKIASVVPDESNDRRQEMRVIQASYRHEIGVYCSRPGTSGNKYNNRASMQRSVDGRLSCMAQKPQDEHDQRHLSLLSKWRQITL